ncbi:MAG TPA: D-glucuronyl C5-epimerase family protein [Solirubrobacteraceae bacterium]
MRRVPLAIAMAVSLAAAPAAASAAEVIVVTPDGRAVVRDDPALRATSDLAAAGVRAPRSCATARAAGGGPTVLGSLARLERAGALSAADHDRYEAAYRHARVVRDRLSGLRKDELSGVIAAVQRLAARRTLTASRVPVVFLQLERNTEYWPAQPVPRAPQPKVRPCAGKAGLGGARVMFGDDPVVFQWYPGQGLQIQQLATFGRANALANACRPEAGPQAIPCDQARLRAALDGIRALAVTRSGFTAWEYYFAFGGGRPPWISGLAQGTAMQALTRGSQVLGDPAYVELAGRALGAFTHRAPVGVRASAPAGPHYLLYSFDSRLRVFNAFFGALNGVFDYAQAVGDERARAVFAAGEREARREVRLVDTGAWSRYSLRGAESDLGYHKLVRDFLNGLCARTARGAYCAAAERFTGYLHQRARLAWQGVRRPRAGRWTAVHLQLSKVSCVTLTARRAGGAVATVVRVLPRGRWKLPWRPPRAGRYTIALDAQDLAGHHTRVARTVTVRRR